MFLSSTAIKTIVGVSSVGGLTAVGTLGAIRFITPPETPILSVVLHQKDAIPADKTLLLNGKKATYACKYGSTTAPCLLTPLQLSDAKTWMNIDEIKTAQLNGQSLSITSSDNKSFFKIEVADSLFDTLKANISTPKVISIVEASSNTEGATLFTADMLFAIDNNKTTFFHKSTYKVNAPTLLAGNAETKTGVFDPSKTHWCSFSNTGAPDSAAKKCSLTEFSTTATAFSQSLTPIQSPIDPAKMYLINYTDHADGIDKLNPLTNQTFYFQEGDDAQSKTSIAKASDIVPVILVPTADSKKYAFVLK